MSAPSKHDLRRAHLYILAPLAACLVLFVASALYFAQWKAEISEAARVAVAAAERAEREAQPAIQQTAIRVLGVDRARGVITIALSGIKARECETVEDSFVGWLAIDGEWRAQDIASLRALEMHDLPLTNIHVPRGEGIVSFGTWRVGDIRVPPQDLLHVSAVRVTVQHDCPLEDGREGSTRPVSRWGPELLDIDELVLDGEGRP